MLKKVTLAALLTSFVAIPAFAQGTNTPVLDKRLNNQERRIEQGEASGRLTTKESANLEKHESKISNDLSAAKADGTVTKQERAKLTREENRQSQRIARKKHNARNR